METGFAFFVGQFCRQLENLIVHDGRINAFNILRDKRILILQIQQKLQSIHTISVVFNRRLLSFAKIETGHLFHPFL